LRPPGPAQAGRAQAIGAIENALLDAKAKSLKVPCYELLGGKVRDRVRVYWSHCANLAINHPSLLQACHRHLDGVKPSVARCARRSSPP